MSRYPVSPRPVRPEFKGKFAHQEGYVQRSDGHWVIDPSATVWVRDPETALAYDTEPGSENWSDLPDSTKRGIEDFNDWLADPDRLPTVKKHQDGEPIARSDDEMRAEFVAVHKEQHLREWGNRDVLAVVEPAFDAWSKRPENAALKNSSSARFVNLYNSTEAAQDLAAQQNARAGRRHEKWAASGDRHTFLNIDGSETAPDDVRRIFGALEKLEPTAKALAFADLSDLRWNGQEVVSDKDLQKFERDMKRHERELEQEQRAAARRREDNRRTQSIRSEPHYDDPYIVFPDEEVLSDEAELEKMHADLDARDKEEAAWHEEQERLAALRTQRRSESWIGKLFGSNKGF